MKQTNETKIKRCETARIWMIVLASALLLGGYLTSLLPVMYACTVPLAVAAVLTYRIKYLEKQSDEGGTDADGLL